MYTNLEHVSPIGQIGEQRRYKGTDSHPLAEGIRNCANKELWTVRQWNRNTIRAPAYLTTDKGPMKVWLHRTPENAAHSLEFKGRLEKRYSKLRSG